MYGTAFELIMKNSSGDRQIDNDSGLWEVGYENIVPREL